MENKTRTEPVPSASGGSQQHYTAEDLLKSQTVGLVHLADFRKRRVEVEEQKERESRGATPSVSGTTTPNDRISSPQPPKKKRKPTSKAKLSFRTDDDEADGDSPTPLETPRSMTPGEATDSARTDSGNVSDAAPSKRMAPNSSIPGAPRLMTKSALLKETQMREQMRKELRIAQEAVKATEICIPFVFYDGTSTPGGSCKVKKGEQIWLFLDRSRRVGAQLGMTNGDNSRKDWARIGVEDLMLVRGEIIIPHHYEFYYFILNRTKGFNGLPLFDYSLEPTSATPEYLIPDVKNSGDEQTPDYNKKKGQTASNQDRNLEGANEEATLTKVVDRRWYEKNKHIYPASLWEDFDPDRDYATIIRKDGEGNTFFFS